MEVAFLCHLASFRHLLTISAFVYMSDFFIFK